MNKKRLSLRVLALPAMIFSLAGFQAAAAVPDAQFYPAKPWQVSADNPQGCSFMNEYNNGFIVQFDGSRLGMNRLRVDFIQDAFQPGTTYNAQISVPGEYDKSLSGQATQPNILSLNLDGDRRLYQALSQSAVFDLNVEGNSFRFFMTGFPAVSSAFEECMGMDDSQIREASNEVQSERIAAMGRDQGREEITRLTPQQDGQTRRSGLQNKPESDIPMPDQDELRSPSAPSAAQRSEPPPTSSRTAGRMAGEPAQTQTTRTPDMKINRSRVSAEIDLTDAGKPPAQAMSPVSSADPGVVKQVTELERQVLQLRRQNESLREKLEKGHSIEQREISAIATENWNLERATMRFNEAERQLQRLSQQLQRERAQCSVEKKELEAMLFDPRVTGQEQLAALGDLEQQLEQARQQLHAQRLRYEERIRILEGQLNTQ